MKRKIVNGMLIMAMVATVCTGCGSGSTQTSDTSNSNVEESKVDEKEEEANSQTESEMETEVESEEASEEESLTIDTSWYEADDSAICTGTYFVGKDIQEGNYVLTCTDTDYAMEVIVFESTEKYTSYFTSSRFTNGEESDAISANASSDEYIYKDDNLAVNIHEGNVLVIKDGTGSLGSGTTQEITGKAIDICKGVYNAGDLETGTYMLTCTEADYGIQVVVFANKDSYQAFVDADPFTNGEVNDAIEKNALYDTELTVGKTCYLNIDSDMVIVIDYEGKGQLVPVNMSWK